MPSPADLADLLPDEPTLDRSIEQLEESIRLAEVFGDPDESPTELVIESSDHVALTELLDFLQWPWSTGLTLLDFLADSHPSFDTDTTRQLEYAIVDHDFINEIFDSAIIYDTAIEACWSRFMSWSRDHPTLLIDLNH